MNASQYVEDLEDKALDLKSVASELAISARYYKVTDRLDIEDQLAQAHAALAAFERLFRQPTV